MRYFTIQQVAARIMTRKILIYVVGLVLVYGCAKKDAAFDDPASENFETPYCNDPIAINYNHGFPGTAQNSVCIYPTDVFKGSYLLRDSIYNGQFELDTVLEYLVSFNTLSLTKVTMSGFCPTGDVVRLTADRYQKASVDSTLLLPDSTLVEGQSFCRSADTIMGSISKYNNDSGKIRINFIIASDTGINYHIGTGIR